MHSQYLSEMNNKGTSYNTEREQIVISEYGRNIQVMIQDLKGIEDRDKRSKAAAYIVSVMEQMHPEVKEVDDYMHKLWDHLYVIAGYDLDIDSPYSPPMPEEKKGHPRRVEYRSNNIKYGHYGIYVINMIKKGAEEEDETKRNALALALANQMKRNYLNWNKNVVNDQLIIDDLAEISNGRLVLPEDTKLITTNEVLTKDPQPSSKKKKKKNQNQNLAPQPNPNPNRNKKKNKVQ